jgi:dihydroorotase
VEHIRQAKARGVKVSAEVTPHHLFLTDEAVIGYNTNTKVNPPLRSAEHREALLAGLVDGTIDCIASDHSPHAQEDKEHDYNTAPFGIVGLETTLGLVLTELLHTGKLDWDLLIERMSIAPRRILTLPENKIAAGATAELTIIDPETHWTVIPDQFRSQARNTPFAGRELKGRSSGIFSKGVFTTSF